jgi:predicted aspartyl protease
VSNIIRAGVAVIVLLLAFSAPLAAGPLEDGLAAYQRGDYALALRHWRPLADQGNAVAQNSLGVMYAKGQGVPPNDAVAVSWYRKAADQGNATAQYNLGAMYEKGRGVQQYLLMAIIWYQKAADQGYAASQYNLGVMYANGGQGILQDYVSAYMWFDLAAAAGYKDAASARDTVATKMTQAQIAEAQGLVDLWRLSRPPRPKQVVAIPGPPPSFAPPARGTLIPLKLEGGTFTVPVSINDKLTLNFVLDSGAADVSIPADVVSTLMRTGTLNAADFLGSQIYRLADGSTVPSQTFRIKSLKLGDKTIVTNVTGSIAPAAGDPLLGQTFLRRFKSWSIDNQRQVLVLE